MNNIQDLPVLNAGEQEAIGKAVVLLINTCPFINGIDVIYEDIAVGAMGVFPTSGTVYLKRFVTGMFIGRYAFQILYRIRPGADETKVREEKRLDALADWLEGRTVTFNGIEYQMVAAPELTDDRTLRMIEKSTNASIAGVLQDGSIDYQVYLQLEYQKKGM